jgi:hypothetical protein
MREGDLAAGLFCAAVGGPFILLLWVLERDPAGVRLNRRDGSPPAVRTVLARIDDDSGPPNPRVAAKRPASVETAR